MKKIYLVIAIALTSSAFAQSNLRTNQSHAANAHTVNPSTPLIVHNPNPPQTNAAGDTVWVFDGLYSYNWNGTLPATYSVSTEDIDGLTINSAYTTYFGTTGSYKIFYYVNAAGPYHYGHADTTFYAAGTSWFSTPGQSDNWFEFGPIHVPSGGGTLKWNHNYPDLGYRDGYQVLVNTVGLASTNFTATPVFSVIDNDPSTVGDTVNTPATVWYPRQANLNAYAGQDIYIAVRQYGFDMDVFEFTNMMLIDNTVALGENSVKANGFFIGTNMPNPSNNGLTSINYTLEKNSNVAFSVTDLQGKVVYTENFANQSTGAHRIDLGTSTFSNGMYFYNFVINGQKVTKKFVVEN